MTLALDLTTGMRLTALMAAVGIVWDAAELLTHRETLGRFFEWPVVRSRYYILLRHKALAALFDVVLTGRTFVALVVAHAVAAIAFVILLPVGRPWVALLALLVLVGHCAIHLRLLVGMDGADQMQSVVWTGLFIFALDLGPIANWAAAIFIVAELLLSYLVAGIANWFHRRGARAAPSPSSPAPTRTAPPGCPRRCDRRPCLPYSAGRPSVSNSGRPCCCSAEKPAWRRSCWRGWHFMSASPLRWA